MTTVEPGGNDDGGAGRVTAVEPGGNDDGGAGRE